MSWLDLVFLHYPIAATELRSLIPAGLRIDEFNGTAWLGVVPFRMVDVAPRFLPAVPRLSTFPEINLRTYVISGDKPGVWFFSLDADSRPTVTSGRVLLGLPYHSAAINDSRDGDWLDFSSVRRAGRAVFRGRYRPAGPVFHAAHGTFEHWAAERYCLYASTTRDRLSRVEVHHAPWPLQHAEADVHECTLFGAAGLPPPFHPPRCHFSPGVNVLAFPPEVVPSTA